MSLFPGSRIGAYEIVGPIGAGGMGEVYRARDLRLGRDVALKTLPDEVAADPQRTARFEREARLLATLNHPNIATIYGFEQQDGVLALAMELVDGDTLEERLSRAARPGRGLDPSSVRRIARQIVEALDAAHEKGIVHRDLKPANVKVTADEVVKVLDFGLAKAVGSGSHGDSAETRSLSPDITRPHVIVGTAAYMSPEQARGQAVDRRTDIWAFGCVLYEMVTGRRAFFRDTWSDTIAAVLDADVDWSAWPADAPPALRALVARCLEPNPKARLRDIADARHDLEGSGVMAMPSGLAQAVPPPATVSRRRLLTGAGAAGVIGAAFGGGMLAAGGAEAAPLPSFQRLTFRRGMIRTARFGPDFQTVFYGALWDGDVCRVYSARPESPESAPLALPPAAPLAVSSSGEIALALGDHYRGIMTYGTLARVALAGGAPRPLLEGVKFADWSADGQALAVVRRDGTRDVLEYPVGTIIAETERSGGGFSFVRLGPQGDAVAVFELDSPDSLFGRVVILTRSGQRRASSERYANVFGLAWHGDEVWFTAADELPLFRNAVHAMNAGGAVRTIARVPGNLSLHDIAPDGRILITRTDDRGGASVRVPGESTERDLSWLDASWVADIARDGRHVLFTENGVGGGPRTSTYLRAADGSAAVRLGDGSARALSPDGRWAIVSSGGPAYDLVPTGAGQPRRLERPGLSLFDVRWLSDGRRVIARAVGPDGAARLYVLDVEGTATHPVAPDGPPVGRARWALSPDDGTVAVATEANVRLLPVAGGAPREVSDTGRPWQLAGWITAGLLMFDETRPSTVVCVDPETGRRQPWAEIRPQDPAGVMLLQLEAMVTTPDGAGYAYHWHRATSDLYLVTGWR